MTIIKTSDDLTRKAGFALILGSLINILRVIPVFLSDGVSAESFPPHSVEDIIFAAQLPVWTITHAMTLWGAILLIFGIAVFARNASSHDQAASGLMAQVSVTLSMVLLSIALISDGLVLPAIIERLTLFGNTGVADNGGLIIYAHLIATSLGGFAATILLISGVFLGITLIRAFKAKILGMFGIAIGGLSLIGYLTGILDLNITATLHITGPLTLLMFLYLITIGVLLLRTTRQTN